MGGGEAGHAVADPSDPDVVYAGEYFGILTRYDHRTRQARNVAAWPDNPSGHGAAFPRYRFQWTAPIAISPHDPKTVYHGGNVLFRTQDGGQTWTAISGDLTRDDETKQRWSGGPITGDNTGAEYYGTIFAVAESPRERGLVWVGSDDGLVHVTRDGGQTWTNVTAGIPGMPEWGTVAAIEPSPFDPAVAYVVVDAHRMDDTRPYLWKTADYGKTWRSLAGGLAAGRLPARRARGPEEEGPPLRGDGEGRRVLARRRRELEGAQAQPADGGGPRPRGEGRRPRGRHPRPLDLHPRRPHGPARVVGEVEAKAVHLFTARPALRWRYDSPISSQVKGPGQNPPQGAVLHYWLKDEPKGDVEIEIRDEKGALVRKLSSRKVEPETPPDDPDAAEDEAAKKALPKKAGLQRAVWDLRYEGATKIKAAKVDMGDPGEGPMVLPGAYSVRLAVDGQSLTTPVEVRLDPRSARHGRTSRTSSPSRWRCATT